MIFLSVIYVLCVGLLIYSYMFYPLAVNIMQHFYTANSFIFDEDELLPPVSILIAAYNEEKVIEDKIESVVSSLNAVQIAKVGIWIGSDNSSDKTNEILQRLSQKYPFIHPVYFKDRQGKPSIINKLAGMAKQSFGEHILMITDANVMFSTSTIYQLIKHFNNPEIALVESNIVSTGIEEKGISHSEKTYVSREITLKYGEGLIFKVFSGPMGGCFAVRSAYYHEVPANFMVDDFYIAMAAIEQGGQAIVEPRSICYEAMSHQIFDEIRRKTRIGIGNYQNMLRFRRLWVSFPFTAISIVLFSHKVIRWLGPILLLLSTFTLFFLLNHNQIYLFLLGLHCLLMVVIPLLYFQLEKLNLHFAPFRLVTYFFAANYALFIAMIRFSKGVKSGVWEPTKR